MQQKTINLRPANCSDADLLFSWVNESTIREMAFDSSTILYEEHINWFKQKLSSVDSAIYIAELKNMMAIGQVRFDIFDNDNAVIDLHLTKKYRGKGLGEKMLKEAVRQFIADKKVKSIHAYVKPGNLASYHTFLRAGFTAINNGQIDNILYFHFIVRSTLVEL